VYSILACFISVCVCLFQPVKKAAIPAITALTAPHALVTIDRLQGTQPYHLTAARVSHRTRYTFCYALLSTRHSIIPERIQFRTAVTVHRCLNGLAPAYLTEWCTPITQSRSSCRLRSSYCNRLAVPSVKLPIGSRSCSASGPTVWNALPDYLRNATLSIDVFKRYLKTFFYLLSINTTL